MALPQLSDLQGPIVAPVEAPRIRRCTFRRLSRSEAGARPGYEVSCLYPDRRRTTPLGDFEASVEICSACTFSGIFRPDED
ncbi:MAG: hypothetical protein ABSG37_06410 [Candidatus Limnocylindrales bacterium]|jgi:hypothetical protein